MPWFGFLVLQNERGAEILSAKAKFSQAFQTWTEFGSSPLQQKTGGQTAALPVRRVLMGYCSRFWGGPQGSLQFLCNFFAFPLFLSFRRRFATGFAKISSLWLHVFPFALSGPAGPVGRCAAEPLPSPRRSSLWFRAPAGARPQAGGFRYGRWVGLDIKSKTANPAPAGSLDHK